MNQVHILGKLSLILSSSPPGVVQFLLLRESIPMQFDKNLGSLRRRRGLEFSRRRKGQTFFPTFLSKDDIAVMYPV